MGDVVDAVSQGRKQLYQGKEYDYFDVNIQESVSPLQRFCKLCGITKF